MPQPTSDGAATVVSGSNGDDVIRASTTDADGSNLFGGAGNDNLKGGKFDDRLDGGEGDDQYWGGAGADAFIFDGRKVSGTDVDRVGDLNFDEGDTLHFAFFNDVFDGALGNNPDPNVFPNTDPTSAIVHSWEGLATLVSLSTGLTAAQNNPGGGAGSDTLILTITYGGGVETIYLQNGWAAYQAALDTIIA